MALGELIGKSVLNWFAGNRQISKAGVQIALKTHPKGITFASVMPRSKQGFVMGRQIWGFDSLQSRARVAVTLVYTSVRIYTPIIGCWVAMLPRTH